MIAGAVAALVSVLAEPAGAHATLVGTDPPADAVVDAPPSVVELRFDEGVETLEDSVRIFGPDGQRVDGGAVETAGGGTILRSPIDGAARGTYTVAWRVTSTDSHTISGSFVFHVGQRTGAVEVSEGDDPVTDVGGFVGRWFGYAGSLVALGAAALALLGPGRGTQAGDWAARERLRRLAGAGALIGFLGVVAALVAGVAESTGRSLLDALGRVPEVAPDTRTGRLALARAALLALGALVALVPGWWRTPRPARTTPVAAGAAVSRSLEARGDEAVGGEDEPAVGDGTGGALPSIGPVLVVLAGAASLITASLSGHAWTASNRWLAVTSDAVHMGAVGVWIGGIVGLLVALSVTTDGRRLAVRFSALALGAAVVVVVSGTVSGWQQIRTLDGLTSTAYGRLVMAKVVGFVALIALGWINRYRLIPVLENAVRLFTRSLRGEVVVAAAVLAVTAVLVQAPPPRGDADSGPFRSTVEIDEGSLDVTVDPARAGSNDLHLFFYGPDGVDPLEVDAVRVTAATRNVPARDLQVTPLTPNHVTVTGASLPSPGTWSFEVTAVRAGQPLVFRFEAPIR